MRVRLIIVTIGIVLCLAGTSCTQKICPAYESYFLLDEESRLKYFSYFDEDSMPKATADIKQNSYGISQGVTPKTYKKHHYNVPMVDVITVDSSLLVPEDNEILTDSVAIMKEGQKSAADKKKSNNSNSEEKSPTDQD